MGLFDCKQPEDRETGHPAKGVPDEKWIYYAESNRAVRRQVSSCISDEPHPREGRQRP
jgi:hypothetical protein